MRMHVWTDRGWHGARTLQAPGCRAVARLDVQGGFGARRLPERRRPARCLPVCGCDTPHDAAETLCALRPRAGPVAAPATFAQPRSEEHTSELQSLMRTSYAVFCLQKKNKDTTYAHTEPTHTLYLNTAPNPDD